LSKSNYWGWYVACLSFISVDLSMSGSQAGKRNVPGVRLNLMA